MGERIDRGRYIGERKGGGFIHRDGGVEREKGESKIVEEGEVVLWLSYRLSSPPAAGATSAETCLSSWFP